MVFARKTAPEGRWRLRWRVLLGRAHNGGVRIERESLVDDAQPEPRPLVADAGGKRLVFPENGSTDGPSEVTKADTLAFHAFVDEGRFPGLSDLRFLVRNVRVLGALPTAPSWARSNNAQPSPRDSLVIGPKTFLDRQGIGLANVLYELFTDSATEWSELERAFRAEFPFVRRIVFPAEPGGSKIAFALEDVRFPDRKVLASEMSDGMVAYLCLLASVLHPLQVGVLGLDEPDANLHPSAIRRLVSLAHRKRSKRRLIIVTHSSALLDELVDPARSIRVVESTKDGAVIRKLDAEALASWREDYTLSEMRRTGLLDASNSSYGAHGTDE
jgi:predicted ATPase